jgi:hypothetical protein
MKSECTNQSTNKKVPHRSELYHPTGLYALASGGEASLFIDGRHTMSVSPIKAAHNTSKRWLHYYAYTHNKDGFVDVLLIVRKDGKEYDKCRVAMFVHENDAIEYVTDSNRELANNPYPDTWYEEQYK